MYYALLKSSVVPISQMSPNSLPLSLPLLPPIIYLSPLPPTASSLLPHYFPLIYIYSSPPFMHHLPSNYILLCPAFLPPIFRFFFNIYNCIPATTTSLHLSTSYYIIFLCHQPHRYCQRL